MILQKRWRSDSAEGDRLMPKGVIEVRIEADGLLSQLEITLFDARQPDAGHPGR